ncbi:mammalian cell entry protein [Mycobacterium barrassiae]|nr:mammalian cell entry protein [Mycobacterium barrassiae]MCV7302004.1 mammalian cell entry protein [Mycobacterium barrassiae]
MEDQPADPGDLTTDAEAADASSPAEPRRRRFSLRRRPKATEPESVSEQPPEEEIAPTPPKPVGKARRARQARKPEPTTTEPAEPAETVASEEPVEAEDSEPGEGRVLVPHRPAGKRLIVAAIVAAVLFVGGAAFAGATLQPYLAERAAVDTKLDVARTAASAISTLWTYTPDNMESLPDRAEVFLGGDFANEYRKYIDAIVAPNKQAQVTNTTQVMGAAVESLSADEATALVYTNSVATSPVTKNIPSLRYLSYRLTMQRKDAKWLITKMSTVTSFDLTPQL